MNSRHLVDPELLSILEIAPDMRVSADTLIATRDRVEAMTQMGLDVPDASVVMSEHLVPSPTDAPDVRIRVYRPKGLVGEIPVLLQIHGGGFLFGSDAMGEPRNRSWAIALDCVVVSVNYRLAPETPYPGALDDCHAVLCWLHDKAEMLAIDATRIAIRGDSAGGGLAAALTLRAREAGGPSILFQLLIYPMLDDRTCTRSAPNPFTGDYVWDRASNAFGWESWLGLAPGSANVSQFAAPARATDLSGLPPAMIATAALDIFVDENLDYARRLGSAGVPTEVYVAPGAYHGFDAMVPDAAIARRFTALCQDALRRAFEA